MNLKLPALAGVLLSGLLLAAPAVEAASPHVPATPPATVIIKAPSRPMTTPAPMGTTATTATTTTTTAGTATTETTTVTHHRAHHPMRHHRGRHHRRLRGAGVKETPFDAANCAHVPTSCSRIHSCAQARRALACGVTALDPDHDGIPCEKLCG